MVAARREARQLMFQGLLGGILAGFVFLVAEMVMNAAMDKAFFGPLRMISTIVLGRKALNPSYPFGIAIFTGLIVNVTLSALFGLIFVAFVNIANTGAATGRLVLYGFLYGTGIWLVNFFLIAPMLFPQFTQVNQFWNGFIAHSVFYGAILGWYTALIWPQQVELQAPFVGRQRHYG